MVIEKRYNAKDLERLAIAILVSKGIAKEDASIVARVLVDAELEGVSSHGLTRIPIYLERIEKGLINKNPNITTNFMFPSLGVMDADNALGHVAGYKAMEETMKKADTYGIAMIGVRNSNHFGAAAYYVNMAVKRGLIGLVISNGPPAISPWGGREPYFGTNPLAVGVPGGDLGPIVIDMATSVVARGKIIKAAQEGRGIELGWALDKEGKPTVDAKSALEGCILPMGGHKGASIALIIELMAGVITGAGYGKQVAWQYDETAGRGNVGHLFCVINPEGFITKAELGERMDKLIQEMKEIPKALGVDEIRIPGERKRVNYAAQEEYGIKLSKALLDTLSDLATKANLQMPIPLKEK